MAERIIKAVEDYLYLPVSAGSQEKKLEIYLERRKRGKTF